MLSTSQTSDELLHNKPLWYAIRIRSNFESAASAALRGKGYEEFLPVYRALRRWSDRVKEINRPLFPGYIFCRFHVGDRLLPILTTPGVLAIVGGKVPIPIADEEIATVRAVVGSGIAAEPCHFINIGANVSVEQGPLAGVEGVVTNLKRKHRLVISVMLLQRSVAVEIDHQWVRPIENSKGRRELSSDRRASNS